tara:strand:- start:96 stop:788 length:693 start_codon:yes stop_codon:yes gene_type:complete
MIIVGNGMISRAFKDSSYDFSDCIIFASGVSNSKCIDPLEFDREFNTLEKTLKYDKRIIYFSTSSIYDDSLIGSSYIKHKLNIESFITTKFKDYIIYRLPNVIGLTKNKNTLFNYFSDSILNERSVSLYKKSTRYILDIDDLVKYVFLTKNTSNSVINLNFNIPYKVTEIWQEVEKALNKKGISTLLNIGNDYKIDNSLFIKEIGENEIPELNDRSYLQKTIQKYLINND